MNCLLFALVLRIFREIPALGLSFVLILSAFTVTCTASETSYVVKRGDTLWGLAQKYGISVSRLADRNGLGKNGYIYAGQRLMIPSDSKTAQPASQLPTSIQRAIDTARVKSGRWKYIVIHHSGVDTGTVQGMDQYHRKVRHMENGLAYHFVIGNGSGMKDGLITACPRWTKQLPGGHLASEAQNQTALGICLVGNFDRHAPSSLQMKSLRLLVQALQKRCRLSYKAVKTHQQINVVSTRCPGSKFPTQSFLRSLKP